MVKEVQNVCQRSIVKYIACCNERGTISKLGLCNTQKFGLALLLVFGLYKTIAISCYKDLPYLIPKYWFTPSLAHPPTHPRAEEAKSKAKVQG